LESWRENNQEGLAVQKIRIGFIGSGYTGQRAHIANYATLPDVELTALAEGRRETAKAVAQRYGIKTTYSNHKEMLEKAKLDAVVAIMHFNLHHAVVPDILEKGLPQLTVTLLIGVICLVGITPALVNRKHKLDDAHFDIACF
jgi:hypothetical protein